MSKVNRVSITLAFAYISFIVGAGFSTGQEILQFFANHGVWGYAAAATAGLTITFVGMQISKLGYILDSEDYALSLNHLFGTRIGRVFDYLLVFFFYGLSVIMIAGTGSAFYDGFGLPAWIGTLFTVITLFIVLQFDFTIVAKILGIITPFLIVAVFIIAGYNIIDPNVPVSEVDQYTDIDRTPSGIWIWDAITYGGLVIANSFGFLVIMGAGSRSQLISKRGILFGGLIFTVLLVLMTAGIIANLEIANEAALPTLLMANEIHPGLRILMTLIMVGVMFNSVIGVLYPFLTRFTKAYSSKYRLMLGISLVAAYILSFIGFVDLVNFFYPIFGYIGIIIALSFFVLWLNAKSSDKKASS
ncbi:YkvI family membrane protein [Salinicoccus bachuensis]|uniref:Membrane protein YkvI n=1 Tax=Salinicoccus bachuensis TaxID=3136731 RepID=A0ABZ3CFX8_9STAP